MKIYTKTGDKGTTALVGGKRVAKNHDRIEAYGTADELIAYIGLLRDHELEQDIKKYLLTIQKNLMVVSAILASDNDEIIKSLPKLSENSIVEIEHEIDRLEKNLPELKSFLIPGGHQAVSVCHICRTVCRRAERRVYDILEKEELPKIVPVYFNRLSDYFFVLSRALSAFFKVEEIIWKPMLD
jgi:cob(I)alamin adenosyltransferase